MRILPHLKPSIALYVLAFDRQAFLATAKHVMSHFEHVIDANGTQFGYML